jgi:hypothetical protein
MHGTSPFLFDLLFKRQLPFCQQAGRRAAKIMALFALTVECSSFTVVEQDQHRQRESIVNACDFKDFFVGLTFALTAPAPAGCGISAGGKRGR